MTLKPQINESCLTRTCRDFRTLGVPRKQPDPFYHHGPFSRGGLNLVKTRYFLAADNETCLKSFLLGYRKLPLKTPDYLRKKGLKAMTNAELTQNDYDYWLRLGTFCKLIKKPAEKHFY